MDSEIKNLTQLNCVDALPVALMSYHMQANRMTHLTPHDYMEIKDESVKTGGDLPEGPDLIRLLVWENVPDFWYGRVDNWMPGGRSRVIVLPTLLCSFGKSSQSQDRL